MKKFVATIGFFDGVHRGHQFLFEQVKNVAVQMGLQPLVVTFDKHPRRVLSTDYVPLQLSTLDEKISLLQSFGIENVAVIPFTNELSLLSARDFMERLAQQYGVKALVMGYDHHFGHDSGTYEEYEEWGREVGIEVLKARELESEKISSSKIRTLVRRGEMDAAERTLGYTYALQGEVVKGYQEGRTMGFPTANVYVAEEKLLPADGVYAARVIMPDGSHKRGVLNIGKRPTLDNGTDTSVEVYLLDFTGNLYSQKIKVEVIKRIREERLFRSKEDLRRQIELDCEIAKHIPT